MDDTQADVEGLVARLRAFGAQWPKGHMRGDEIYEITNRDGHYSIRASDLRQAADIIERLTTLQTGLEAAEARAATAEYRLYSFRQHNAARWKQLSEFVKERAPDLWPDYAAVSVNGSTTYGADEPHYEREMNMLRHRVDAAEERAVEAEAALKKDQTS